MSDPYISGREREQELARRKGLEKKQTLEVVELERQKAALPPWQQAMVNGFAIVGVIAVIALILAAFGAF